MDIVETVETIETISNIETLTITADVTKIVT